mgnify:FL=1
MADPYAKFADAPQAPDADPYAAYADAAPAKPSGPLIDPSLSRTEVRAKLAALPAGQRKQALKDWADAKVKVDRDAESKTLMGRLSNTDASREYVSGGFGGVIGPWLDEINAGMQAATRAAFQGEKFADAYEMDKALEGARRKAIEAQDTHLFTVPGVDKVLGEGAGDVTTGTLRKIAGGVMTAPFTPGMRGVGAGGGSAAAPIVTPASSVAAQMLKAVPVTSMYGGLAGLGEGDDATERLSNAKTGAIVGAVTGGLAPPIARGVGNTVGYIGSKLEPTPAPLAGYSRNAVERVARAVNDDNVASARVPATPETMVADLGPNLRGQAGAIANQPGEGQSTIRSALNARRDTAAGRIEAATDQALGPAQNLVDLERFTAQNANARAAPFRAAYESANIPMTPRLAQVIDRAQASGAMKEAQRLIDIEGPPKTEAAFYDYVKRGLDSLSENAQGPHGRATTLSRAYGNLARDLRETIDDILVPGGPSSPKDIVAHFKAGGTPDQVSPYALARYYSGEGLQFRDALEEGGKAFSRGTHPDQLRADMGTMTAPEHLGYVAGARGQVRDTIGNAASSMRQNGDIKAMQQLGSPYARDKLDQIALPGTARKLTDRLDAEATHAETYNDVIANSKTAARQAAQKEFPVDAEVSKTPDFTGTTAVGVGVQAARSAIDALRGGNLTAKQVRTAADAAKMLVAQGADRDVIVRNLIAFSRSKQATQAQKTGAEYIVFALTRSAGEPSNLRK